MGPAQSDPKEYPSAPLPEFVPLPHEDPEKWAVAVKALTDLKTTIQDPPPVEEGEAEGEAEGPHIPLLAALLSAIRILTPHLRKSSLGGLMDGITAFGGDRFYDKDSGTLLYIVAQALRFPELFGVPDPVVEKVEGEGEGETGDAKPVVEAVEPKKKRIPFLKKTHPGLLELSKEECVTVLAGGFFSLYDCFRTEPWSRSVPGLNFGRLFACPADCQPVPVKVRMFLTFFERMRAGKFCAAQKTVRFTRLYKPRPEVPPKGLLQEHQLEAPKQAAVTRAGIDALTSFIPADLQFSEAEVIPKGSLRDAPPPSRHADFANRSLGGGVFGTGCVQEEIMFAENPECCVGMLFCEYMGRDEAILISGTERFSWHTGYAWKLAFDEDKIDEMEDPAIIAGVDVVAMDAMDYRGGFASRQFHPSHISRDVWKAFVAFGEGGGTAAKTVSTGNWGCGAFLGDKNLKFVEQYLAASASGVKMVYYTFMKKGEEKLNDSYRSLVEFVRKNNVLVKDAYAALLGMYDVLKKKHVDIDQVVASEVLKKILLKEDFELDDVN